MKVRWVNFPKDLMFYHSYYTKAQFIPSNEKDYDCEHSGNCLCRNCIEFPTQIMLVRVHIKSWRETVLVLFHEFLHYLFYKLRFPEKFNELLDEFTYMLTER